MDHVCCRFELEEELAGRAQCMPSGYRTQHRSPPRNW